MLLKTVLLCLVATFLMHLMLLASPRVEPIRVPIRGSDPADRSGSLVTPSSHVPNGGPAGISSGVEMRLSYIAWVSRLLRGDLGRTAAGERVTEEIGRKLPATLTLSIAAFVPAVLVALLFNLVGASSVTASVRRPVSLLTTLPAFMLGYLIIALVGYQASSAPRYLLGIVTLFLSCGIVNDLGRVMAGALESESARPYIETARAKGLSESPFPRVGTVSFHALRNAMIAVLPRVGLIFGFAISGSMVVEQVFDIPGLSFMMLNGLADRDASRVLVVVLLGVVLARVGSVLAGFVYVLLNPRYGIAR